MGRTTLGIDIGDDLLSAVAVDGTGRDAQVMACAFMLRTPGGEANLTGDLARLLERLGERRTAERCIAGFSLSCLSLRNLSLPFADEKKIRQILPFELEEQLLLPLDEQIIAAVPALSSAEGTGLLAAAAEKTLLRQHVEAFQANGLEPDLLCPSVHVLADRLCRSSHAGNTFLLLHGDLCALKMVLVHAGEIVFMRCLSYPDAVFTHAVFRYEHNGAAAVMDPAAAEEAMQAVCRLVQQSLDCFCQHMGQDIRPEHFVLAGPMQSCAGFREALAAGLGLSGRAGDLALDSAVPAAVCAAWQPAVHDAALALALLSGRRAKANKEGILNFRQHEFAPPHHLLRSKKQIMAAALIAVSLLTGAVAYLLFDRFHLQKKYDRLMAQMELLFRQSFPGVDPGRDPLTNMRSKLKSMDTVTVAAPIFTEEKRVLVILADISARIPESIHFQVARMIIDQNSVRIKGSTDAFNNVNAIQDLLSKSGRYAEVTIVSATKGKEKEGILFEIRLQLGPEGRA